MLVTICGKWKEVNTKFKKKKSAATGQQAFPIMQGRKSQDTLLVHDTTEVTFSFPQSKVRYRGSCHSSSPFFSHYQICVLADPCIIQSKANGNNPEICFKSASLTRAEMLMQRQSNRPHQHKGHYNTRP